MDEYLSVSGWLKALEESPVDRMRNVYGSVPTEVLSERKSRVYESIKAYLEHFGNENVAVVRCPGRVNLRGMHIDSHGGACNGLALDREIILVFSKVEVSRIVIHNDGDVVPCDGEVSWTDVSPATKTWLKYVDATVKVLSSHYKRSVKCGWKGLLTSDIPRGCGLSSSHALVLCLIQATLLVNHMKLDRIEMIELARKIEFEAGSVTGLGDQGVMEFARAGSLVHANFYQEDLESIAPQYAPFPSSCALVIANSMKERSLSGAQSSDYALPRFAYSIGLAVLKSIMRKEFLIAEKLVEEFDRLSRFNPIRLRRFGGEKFLYELLLRIPERISLDDLRIRFPKLDSVISNAAEKYLSKLSKDCKVMELELRGPLLYGIAECRRSERFFEFMSLAEGARSAGNIVKQEEYLQKAGNLMNLGHFGDKKGYQVLTDNVLHQLIADSTGKCSLELQPGDFRASVEILDELQSIMMGISYGASLTGAGMGGVVIALTKKENSGRMKDDLWRKFHYLLEDIKHTTIDDFVFVCYPVNGTGFVHPRHILSAVPKFPDSFNEQGKEELLSIYQHHVTLNNLRILPVRNGKRSKMTTEALRNLRDKELFGKKHLRVIVTGAGGFIGSHVVDSLCVMDHEVHIIDNCNSYYDPSLKFANLHLLDQQYENCHFHYCDIRLREDLERVVEYIGTIDLLIHLAARAGVRPSMKFPELYRSTNINGTENIIELCIQRKCRAVVYASSSSVYGAKPSGPFREDTVLSEPESVYAATKVENERFASIITEKYGTKMCGLRFFTVDGPMLSGEAGRPDMAIASFIRMLEKEEYGPLTMYGCGGYRRDFSFVHDIVQGIILAASATYSAQQQDLRWNEVFNFGEEDVTSVRDVIVMLAAELGLVKVNSSLKCMPSNEVEALLAELIMKGLVKSVVAPVGDVPLTHASIEKSRMLLGYDPKVKIEDNVRRTVVERHPLPMTDGACDDMREFTRLMDGFVNQDGSVCKQSSQSLGELRVLGQRLYERWKAEPSSQLYVSLLCAISDNLYRDL